jgi:[ribosomal protein S5]-alanine N-acetyltransferase
MELSPHPDKSVIGLTMIEAQRLLLRPFVASDEREFLPNLMCPDFMVYSPSGALDSDQAQSRFSELIQGVDENGFGKLAVIEKSSRKIIGYCGTESCVIEDQNVCELGFRLVAEFRNKGYATEAARALLAHEKAQGVIELVAFTEPGNVQSINVLTKLGFVKTGHSSYLDMPIVLFKVKV